jgi:monoamine oxidase
MRRAASPLLAAAALALALSGAHAQTPAAGTAIVIGAGLSGLSAADALCAKGYKVTILEGRSRTGGRTFTTKLPITGTSIEVGAGWIHDAVATRNSIAAFTANNSIATQTDDEEGEGWRILDAPPTAGKIVGTAKYDSWEAKAEIFQDQIANAEDNWAANQSLQSKFDAFKTSQGLTGDDLNAVKVIIQSDNADLEYGATMGQISARWCDEGDQGEGPEKVISKGYSAVADALIARIQSAPSCKGSIVLNAPVAEIKTVTSPSSSRGVAVRLQNGTALSAKFAITTLPLGVLKQGGVKFSPGLSTEKTNAIAKLGMGLLNKIALVYDRPFFLQAGAGGVDNPSLVSWFAPFTAASNPRPPAEGDAYEWWNHAKFWPGSNAVIMLLGADTAQKWEALNPTLTTAQRDALLAQKADALFRQLFPSSTAVLRESLVTRWSTDPFTYGSYSYTPVGASPGLRTKLCATQSSLLFWAGEHCSTSFPSTANGAMDTGVAAAKAAMALFKPPAATGRR